MSVALLFDSGLPKILTSDGSRVEIPAEVVAQASHELPLLDLCTRYAKKLGLAEKGFAPLQHVQGIA